LISTLDKVQAGISIGVRKVLDGIYGPSRDLDKGT